MAEKVKALVVDDSAYMRVILKDMLESDGNIAVVGVAKDGLEAVEKVKSLAPDVVVLDIQMPKMDGVATLKRIMKEAPTRVVMLSAMDKVDDQLPLKALELGAVDFISKPSGPVSVDIVSFSDRICDIVKEASAARVEALKGFRTMPKHKLHLMRKEASRQTKAVVIAASTGGPRAIESVFAALPRDLPASFFVVQHIPPEFSGSFAKRLNSVDGPRVVLASDGERVSKGVTYVAPGGKHLTLTWRGATSLMTRLDGGSPVNFVGPSADVLFKSAAECLHDNVLAIVLTGLGSDGAKGAAAVRSAGGRVVVQDEQTSVVFGMPRSTIELGAAHKVLPLDRIAEEIIEFLEED